MQSPRNPLHQHQAGAGAPRELHCSSTGAGQEVQPLETPQRARFSPPCRGSVCTGRCSIYCFNTPIKTIQN